MQLSEEQYKHLRKHHLTEDRLGELLHLIYPDTTDWLHDKKFLTENFRPDYRSDSLKLVVEFDGYHHYSKPTVIIRDEEKTKLMEEAGYKVVRIPHFIQLETNSIKYFFGLDIELPMVFKHGFWVEGDMSMPPATMCELGIIRFLTELELLKETKEGRFIRRHIVISLINKIAKHYAAMKDTNLDLAESLVSTILCSKELFVPYDKEDRKELLNLLKSFGSELDVVESYGQPTIINTFGYNEIKALVDNGFAAEYSHQWLSPTVKEHLDFLEKHKDTAYAFVDITDGEEEFNTIICSGIGITSTNEQERQDFIDTWENKAGKNGLYIQEESISTTWR